MIKLPKQNFDVRLQLIGCCLAEKATVIRNKQRFGTACVEEIKLFEYFIILLEVLKCYTVDDTLTTAEQDDINIFDTCVLDDVFEKFAEYCDICFPLPEAELETC